MYPMLNYHADLVAPEEQIAENLVLQSAVHLVHLTPVKFYQQEPTRKMQ